MFCCLSLFLLSVPAVWFDGGGFLEIGPASWDGTKGWLGRSPGGFCFMVLSFAFSFCDFVGGIPLTPFCPFLFLVSFSDLFVVGLFI